MKKEGRFPTLHIEANSIPEAHYKAIRAVWERGAEGVRTQYDRKDSQGRYIDPPSRDARVLIEVTNPFAEPRFSPISFCEIGKYIGEIMGVKDHLVVPFAKLKGELASGGVISTEWPYAYHQRLASYPTDEGTIDQIEIMLDKVAETFYTRRAVAQTGVPEVDPFMKEDLPCLREMHLRCLEDDDGILRANLTTLWRSRDLYKAWGDNVIGITNLQRYFAERLTEKMGREVKPGSYADFSTSLHIYGQDFAQVGGDEERGIRGFLDNFPDVDSFIAKAMTSIDAMELLVIPQLEQLLNETYWNFPEATKEAMRVEIERMKAGEFTP